MVMHDSFLAGHVIVEGSAGHRGPTRGAARAIVRSPSSRVPSGHSRTSGGWRAAVVAGGEGCAVGTGLMQGDEVAARQPGEVVDTERVGRLADGRRCTSDLGRPRRSPGRPSAATPDGGSRRGPAGSARSCRHPGPPAARAATAPASAGRRPPASRRRRRATRPGSIAHADGRSRPARCQLRHQGGGKSRGDGLGAVGRETTTEVDRVGRDRAVVAPRAHGRAATARPRLRPGQHVAQVRAHVHVDARAAGGRHATSSCGEGLEISGALMPNLLVAARRPVRERSRAARRGLRRRSTGRSRSLPSASRGAGRCEIAEPSQLVGGLDREPADRRTRRLPVDDRDQVGVGLADALDGRQRRAHAWPPRALAHSPARHHVGSPTPGREDLDDRRQVVGLERVLPHPRRAGRPPRPRRRPRTGRGVDT